MSTTSNVPRRWSCKAKRDVVMRLMRGEEPDAISREISIPVFRLRQWRERAVLGMEPALKERDESDPLERQLSEAQATIGRLTMKLELHRGKARGRTR